MKRCKTLIHVAVLSLLVNGCSSEDSVMKPGGFLTGSSEAGSGAAGVGTAAAGASAPRAGSTAGSAGTGTTTPATGITGAAAGTASGAAGVGAGGMASAGGMAGAGTDDALGTGGTGTAEAADCDMNGLWVSRMLTVTDALNADQCANLYAFYELRQDGANVEVANYFDCGLRASGSGDAAYGPATRKAMLALNSQVGRKGTMMKGADGTCQLDMGPFWYILGGETSLLPSDRESMVRYADVQSAMPLPNMKGAPGLVDVEHDGFSGVATVVTNSAVTGTRHGVLRNVRSWKTDDFYQIMPSTTWDSDIEARLSYIGEENSIEAYDEQGSDAPFLLTPAVAVPQADAARITLHFLGRDASDPRAQEIVVSSDPTDVDGAIATCDNMIEELTPILPDYGTLQRCPCPNGKPADDNRKCTK